MVRAVAVLMLAAAAGLLWSRRAAAAALVVGGAEVQALPEVEMQQGAPSSFFDAVSAWIPEKVTDTFYSVADQVETMSDQEIAANVAAFLAVIRKGEGTADANGYRRMFGGKLFDSFADHPRQKNTATFGNGKTVTSTAAGAYQFLSTTWDEAARALNLPDFSPASQDAAALYLIRRRGALADVEAGRFDVAVRKVAKEWASLPGSPYGQPTLREAEARQIYTDAGGVFA